jgi:predicted RNA-binding protein YlxR (DUF448 family)
MPRSNHKPVRTCLGCNERDLKSAFVRIAAMEADVVVDAQARLGGRGGYIHARARCLERFERSRVREFRSLGRKVSLDARRQITELIRARLDRRGEVE